MINRCAKFISSVNIFLDLKLKILNFASYKPIFIYGDIYYSDSGWTEDRSLLFVDLMKRCGDEVCYVYNLDPWNYNGHSPLPMIEIPMSIDKKDFLWSHDNDRTSEKYMDINRNIDYFIPSLTEFIVFSDSMKWHMYSNDDPDVSILMTAVGVPDWYRAYAEEPEDINYFKDQIKKYLDSIAKNPL